MSPYPHQEIEKKWQERWEARGVGIVKEDSKKKSDALYHLIMWPYPSGSGLHVGHVESYTAVDILTRFERMRGKNVLFPIGYDAFGLPAENYAIKTGVPPAQTTKNAIATFHRQMKALGLSFDWSREISAADPEYYQWSQWMFLQLYKKGLAYRAKAPVNWCPSCATVLANEQVVSGRCERCDSEVEPKELEQWFFKITDFADRLLAGLEKIDWPDTIKSMQKNWIGRSEGVFIQSKIKDSDFAFEVWDSVPQTFCAQTFSVIAPEHPKLTELVKGTPQEKEVMAFVERMKKQRASKSFDPNAHVEGIFTGRYVEDPFGTGDLPLWVASYVVMGYGSGIVHCSAHDERDFAFAKKYGIALRPVMFPKDEAVAKKVRALEVCYAKDPAAMMEEPAEFRGRAWGEARGDIITHLEKKGIARRGVNYRLRDWLVSRQRYWGTPIPIIWCEACGQVPVPEKDLPVLLPEDVDFKPTGESPLARSESFHQVSCPSCGKAARRESDTMDTFVDSSWYYLRYCDAHNEKQFADKKAVEYWCPVDLYVGGAEHAVLHLLYARFFAYALHDMGHIKFEEPFLKLRNQGTILGPDGQKMSKSRGNVINPDVIVEQYGADTLRMYEMFMGPLEDAKPWDTNGVVGIRRFLEKVWRLVDSDVSLGGSQRPKQSSDTDRLLHKTIKKVTEDLEAFKFNTAIAQMMILVNSAPQGAALETLVTLLAPFAPHLAEELWEKLGAKDSVFDQSWPTYDPKLVKDELVAVAVQVNGKLRGTVELAPDAAESDALATAKSVENVAKYLAGATIKKAIYIPGRMINFVL